MKQLLVFLFLLCSAIVFAQDVIVKKDGSTIVCRVVELNSSEIVYKKWSDQNGSNYVMNRADASAINYENGKKVNLSEATNLYKPNNQNDGTQQYNDRALMQIDKITQDPLNKAKRERIIGIVGGSCIAAGGVLWMFIAENANKREASAYVPGAVLCLGGVTFATTFLLMANREKKKAQMIQSLAIYQCDFRLSNSSSISASIDILSGHTISNKTVGLGLSYNF